MACGRYDRTQPLIDGRVEPEGVDLTFIPLRPGETFWRMLNHDEFDVSEMSLSSYTILRSEGDTRFIAIPVFPSRVFRHSAVYLRADSKIEKPQDLKGKRIGVGDYQMTAAVWVRGFLAARLRRAARRRHLGDRPAGAHHQAAGGHPRRIHVARDDARGHAGARRDRRAGVGDDSENTGHNGAAAVRRSAQSRARLLRAHPHLSDHAHLRAEDKTLRGRTPGWRSASIAPSAGRATSPITGCTTPTR